MTDFLSTKHVGESITTIFDFEAALLGETISAIVSLAVSVVSGVDALPNAILDGAATNSTTRVFQRIIGGVAGAAYRLVCTIDTSDGRRLILDSILPVVGTPETAEVTDSAAYCTKEDLIRRFGSAELAQLTDEANAANVDSVDVDSACNEATSLIDLYLAPRYELPLADPIPSIVRKWACDIARYFLRGDRVKEGDSVHTHYVEAIEALEKIADGKLDLLILVQVTGFGEVVVGTSEQVFTDELLAYMP